MTVLDATLLGILQGLTEFLPISSSGHLVVAQYLMNVSDPGVLFEVAVHIGTLMSILIIFRRHIKALALTISSKESRNVVFYIVLGTIPVATVGVTLKSSIEVAFENVQFVAIAFLVTALVLILTRFVSSERSEIDAGKSLLVGISQAIALLPGISRSGFTISSALMLGVDSEQAFRFSFLLAIPALIGSGLLSTREFLTTGSGPESLLVLGAGSASAFIVGLIALKLLQHVLKKGQFHWFGAYCLVAGFITLGL